MPEQLFTKDIFERNFHMNELLQCSSCGHPQISPHQPNVVGHIFFLVNSTEIFVGHFWPT